MVLAGVLSALVGAAAWVSSSSTRMNLEPSPAFSARRLPSPTSSFANLLKLEGTSPQALQAKLSSQGSLPTSPSPITRVRGLATFVLLVIRMLIWRCVGLMDNLYILTRLFKGRDRPLFFSDGWGDLQVIRSMFASTCEDLKCGSVVRKLADAGPLRWASADDGALPASLAGMCIRKGSFRSPCHTALPAESRDCDVEFCYPEGTAYDLPWVESSGTPSNASGSAPPAIVLLLPATGEEDSSERRQIAHALAARGLCSIIVTAPYYGTRRPARQRGHYVRTVAGYLIQSAALTFEAAHVMRCCAARWPGVQLCLSGFSWGGAMSGVVGVVGSQCLADSSARVVAVPYAGSPTAAVIADGVLAADIDWSALATAPRDVGGGASEGTPGPHALDAAATRAELLKELLAMHLSSFTDALKEGDRSRQRSLDGLHAVCFRDDSFVKVEYADELYQLLASCCRGAGGGGDAGSPKPDGAAALQAPASVQQWLGGGHARAYLSKAQLLPQIILSALHYS